jgi:hypothetical protein
MQRSRHAGLVAALLLGCAVGCLNDISNLAPYAGHIGATYRLTYADAFDCELWPPKAPGADYVILPHLPQLEGSKKQKGLRLPEGTLLRVEAAKRGEHGEDYLLVTLDDPAKPGHRIEASVQPKYLEGWPDQGRTGKYPTPES